MIADYACVVGEGPLWHPVEQRVYWTDIDTGRLFHYDPNTDAHGVIYQGPKVGGFTLQEDGSLLLFMDSGAVRVWRDGAFGETIHDEILDERTTRFNDVIADPMGRVFCGTMPNADRLGRLYRMDHSGELTIVRDGVGCSNGMGFTTDLTTMYYTDTAARTIFRFAYNAEDGAISDETVFVRVAEGQGGPDGLTLDADGNVWSARWGGGCLVCHAAKDSRELHRIPFPVPKVSSAIFGGPDLTDLYVTTAGGDRKETDGPFAGALFRVRIPGIRGVPEFRSRICRGTDAIPDPAG